MGDDPDVTYVKVNSDPVELDPDFVSEINELKIMEAKHD